MRVDYKAVVQCAGPWRVSERAFIAEPVTRDEYDVGLDDGSSPASTIKARAGICEVHTMNF